MSTLMLSTMNYSTGSHQSCKRCSYEKVDINLSCGCNFHVRCIPLSFFSDHSGEQRCFCPSCSRFVSQMFLRPLELSVLETVKVNDEDDPILSIGSVRKRGNHYNEVSDTDEVEAQKSAFLVWSNLPMDDNDNDRLHFRTGRWSHEETVYVERIIQLFDGGCFALPNGIKLNELLRDLLLCKSSRLTKKMKNAKLSTRSYRFNTNDVSNHLLEELSRDQQKFLDSINSTATREIIRVNMTRTWRVHFSNFCLQVSYDKILTNEFIVSMEDMKHRVKQAEEEHRNVRRKRLEFPTTEPENEINVPDVIIPDIIYSDPNEMSGMQIKQYDHTLSVQSTSMAFPDPNYDQADDKDDFWIGIFDVDYEFQDETVQSENEEGFSKFNKKATKNNSSKSVNEPHSSEYTFSNSAYPCNSSNIFGSYSGSGSYLERVMTFIQSENLPFDYADVWVPCVSSSEHSVCLHSSNDERSNDLITLIHAGDAVRSDLSAEKISFLNQFGLFSKTHSNQRGSGLARRVYSSGNTVWEHKPSLFSCRNESLSLEVETAVAIPVKNSTMSMMVVVLYSFDHIDEDTNIIEKIIPFIQQADLRPKWSLYIDVPDGQSQFAHTRSDSFKMNERRDSSMHSSFSNSSELTNNSVTSAQLTALDAITLANLLAEYMPVEEGITGIPSSLSMNPLSTFISLRLLLLRYPVGCSAKDQILLDTLKKKYDSYMKNSTGKEAVARQLVRDWMHLKTNGCSSVGNDVVHVNYSVDRQNENPQTPDGVIMSSNRHPFTYPILNLPPAVSSDFEKLERTIL